jgi:hypothetical protein
MLLKKYIGKPIYDHYGGSNDSLILKSKEFVEKSKELLRSYLADTNVKNLQKKELVQEIRNRKNAITKLVILRGFTDFASGILKAIIFAVIIVALTTLAGYPLYKFVSSEFFILPYIVFDIVSGIVALLIFWFNYKDRGLKNVYVKSFIQVALIVIFMIALFIGVQKLLGVLNYV